MKKTILFLLLLATPSYAQVTVPTNAQFLSEQTRVNSEINTLKMEIAAINARLATLENNDALTKTALDAMTVRINELTARVVKLEGDVEPPTNDWIFCANENGTCSFTGTKEVRYGANESYFYKVLTSPVSCDNTTFGDPIFGVNKQCYYRNPVTTPVLTYVDPPSNEVCYTSAESESKAYQWDTDGPGPTVEGYHVFVGTSPDNYDLPLIPAGINNTVTYSFMGVETRCLRVKGYVMQ